jgi:hypothetical protein
MVHIFQYLAQKPVTFLAHENFLVYQSQPVTPVKHGKTHFATLNAPRYKNGQKKSAF